MGLASGHHRRDMVRAQKCLIDSLGIETSWRLSWIHRGMQALQWAVDYPEIVRSAVILARPIDSPHKE